MSAADEISVVLTSESNGVEKKERFDHDGFWKDLIARFFYPLLLRALPKLYADADLETPPKFLDKEFRDILNTADPSIHTSPHFADFLLEVPLKNGTATWIICHIEIQGQRGGNLSRRMFHYFSLIFAHYMKVPAALAVVTDKRPAGEAAHFAETAYDTEVLYRYNRLVLEELDDDELLESENPIDLVLYAAKCALRTKEELQKYRYLRKSTELLANRGWNQNDKRDLMLFLERVTNLKDKRLIAEYTEYQRQLDREGKIVYVPLLAREYLERGMEEGEHLKALKIARKMMAQKMPISAIADITELSENEIRDSLN